MSLDTCQHTALYYLGLDGGLDGADRPSHVRQGESDAMDTVLILHYQRRSYRAQPGGLFPTTPQVIDLRMLEYMALEMRHLLGPRRRAEYEVLGCERP